MVVFLHDHLHIWKARGAFWVDRTANESTLRNNLLSLPTTRTRRVKGSLQPIDHRSDNVIAR
jgi:hypothetical protein